MTKRNKKTVELLLGLVALAIISVMLAYNPQNSKEINNNQQQMVVKNLN